MGEGEQRHRGWKSQSGGVYKGGERGLSTKTGGGCPGPRLRSGDIFPLVLEAGVHGYVADLVNLADELRGIEIINARQ